MEQFKCDLDILTAADSGRRDTSKLLWCVIHTTENPLGTPPEQVAKWQQDTSNNSSYNVLFGSHGKTVRGNDDDYSPWAAGMPGNRLGIHGSAVAYASTVRARWLQYPHLLTSIARWLAHNYHLYGIPLRELTVEEVRSRRVKGVTTHGVYWQAIGKAQGMATRTDPGAGFPMDVVLAEAREIVEKVGRPFDPPPPPPVPDLILDQLVGHPWPQFPGWKQLGNRTLVDAVAKIGEHVGIDWNEK